MRVWKKRFLTTVWSVAPRATAPVPKREARLKPAVPAEVAAVWSINKAFSVCAKPAPIAAAKEPW